MIFPCSDRLFIDNLNFFTSCYTLYEIKFTLMSAVYFSSESIAYVPSLLKVFGLGYMDVNIKSIIFSSYCRKLF